MLIFFAVELYAQDQPRITPAINTLDDSLQSLEDGYSTSALSGKHLSIVPNLESPKFKSVLTEDSFKPEITIKRFGWIASGEQHRNLLFEEPMLERHGQTRNELIQPILSGTLFLKRSILIPFGLKKHQRCESPRFWGIPSID